MLLLSQVHFDPPTLPSQPPYTFQFGADYTATITLPRNYLLNILFIEPFPDSPAEQSKFWYSYIISVSLNRHTWLKLFDYTSAQCRGRQQLMFPKIPVRYVFCTFLSLSVPLSGADPGGGGSGCSSTPLIFQKYCYC